MVLFKCSFAALVTEIGSMSSWHRSKKGVVRAQVTGRLCQPKSSHHTSPRAGTYDMRRSGYRHHQREVHCCFIKTANVVDPHHLHSEARTKLDLSMYAMFASTIQGAR